MSKSKDQIEPTPQSSSEGKTEGQAPLVEPSPKPVPIEISTQPMSPQSPDTSRESKGAPSETDYLHAEMMQVSLQNLMKAGLIKRYEVRSKDEEGKPTTLLKIRLEFDLQQWTEKLELR